MEKINMEGVKVTVTVESTVDPGWIEFVTGGPEGMVDIFFNNGHCGYWMMGVAHDPEMGWLAFEFAAEDRRYDDAERDMVVGLWKAGNALPAHWHRLNMDLARRSWIAGYQKDGTAWYENGDGVTYNCAVQQALLGEVTYG